MEAHRIPAHPTQTLVLSRRCKLPNMADCECEIGDDGRPTCSQCERTGQKCHRTKDKRSFRVGSSAQYEKKFAKDQVWLGFTKNGRLCHWTTIQLTDTFEDAPTLPSIFSASSEITVYLASPCYP